MASCSEWLAVRVCPLSAVVVWSQSLYTFHCQVPLYQGSPNWVISRCLYRAAQCHMHTLHSLPVSFWQYIIYSFRLLVFFQDQQPYWFGFGGCRYRFTQQFEFTWLNDTSKVYVGYSILLSHSAADSNKLSLSNSTESFDLHKDKVKPTEQVLGIAIPEYFQLYNILSLAELLQTRAEKLKKKLKLWGTLSAEMYCTIIKKRYVF